MRIAILAYLYQAGCSTHELLDQYPVLCWQAEGLRDAGAEVIPLIRWHQDENIQRNGITYHFVADPFGPHLRPWHIPHRFHRVACQHAPDVAHIHGMGLLTQAAFLRTRLPRSCKLVVQHHSERPAASFKRLIQQRCARAVNGFLFPTPELAQEWLDAGVISSKKFVHVMPEASSWVRREDPQHARARTGLTGTPTLLWVAHLNAGKDPLTVLRGFEKALAHLPQMRLYMAHGAADTLLPAVQALIQNSPALAQSVVLLSQIARADLGLYYASADYFVIGSTRYGGILALTEALACGVVPIVTDTPYYRAMTQDTQGTIGALWQMGDPNSLAQAIIQIAGQPREPIAQRAMQIYKEHLSWPVLSRQALAIYEKIT